MRLLFEYGGLHEMGCTVSAPLTLRPFWVAVTSDAAVISCRYPVVFVYTMCMVRHTLSAIWLRKEMRQKGVGRQTPVSRCARLCAAAHHGGVGGRVMRHCFRPPAFVFACWSCVSGQPAGPPWVACDRDAPAGAPPQCKALQC